MHNWVRFHRIDLPFLCCAPLPVRYLSVLLCGGICVVVDTSANYMGGNSELLVGEGVDRWRSSGGGEGKNLTVVSKFGYASVSARLVRPPVVCRRFVRSICPRAVGTISSTKAEFETRVFFLNAMSIGRQHDRVQEDAPQLSVTFVSRRRCRCEGWRWKVSEINKKLLL